MHWGRRAGRWPARVGACMALCALAAAPARAADAVIDGSPLNIYADDNGRLQVAFDGTGTGEFFLPSLAPANAGLNIALSQNASPFAVFGFLGSPFLSATAPAVSGDGSSGNPWVLTTSYRTGMPSTGSTVRVDQRLTYVNGTTDVGVQYVLVDEADVAAPITVR